MNKEYIEREAVFKELDSLKADIKLAMLGVYKAVGVVPVADVAPVVHAHWKTREEHNDYLWVECSNCGFRVENYKAVKTGMSSTDIVGNKWNGCPVCCARMDGGSK